MYPNKSNNYCWGGGGGFLQSGYNEERREYGRLKLDQILATGADYCIAACHNCHAQIHDLAEHFEASYHTVHLWTLICLSLGVLGDGSVNTWDWSTNEWGYRLERHGDGTMGYPVEPCYRELPGADRIRVPDLRDQVSVGSPKSRSRVQPVFCNTMLSMATLVPLASSSGSEVYSDTQHWKTL